MEDEQVKKMWPVLCAAVLGMGTIAAASSLFGRTPNIISTVLILGAILIGVLLGITLRKSKSMRKASLCVCVVLALCVLGLAKYLVSDAWKVRAAWPSHKIGITTFSYPSDFYEKTKSENLIQNGTVRIFTNENTKRFVCYMIYDFTDSHPELEDSLDGAVQSFIKSYGAHFVAYDENVERGINSVRTRFTYTRQGKTYTGIAYGAQEGAHVELLIFLALRKNWSLAFLNRIEAEIVPSAE